MPSCNSGHLQREQRYRFSKDRQPKDLERLYAPKQ